MHTNRCLQVSGVWVCVPECADLGPKIVFVGLGTPNALLMSENPLLLWAHIVSQHAAIISPDASLEELVDVHDHEHQGPGTIRNHDPKSREFELGKLVMVLSESEEVQDVIDKELDRLTLTLHRLWAHPDYEYTTTKNGVKSGEKPRPDGEGWEDNVCERKEDGSLDANSCWRRFDWVEENYWRRRKPT